jgi:hypothetical protein
MKKYLFVVAAIFLFDSCAGTEGLVETRTRTWVERDALAAPQMVYIENITVEAPGVSYAVREELAVIVPLLFFEYAFIVTEDRAEADYSAALFVSERDYLSGWETKKSVALNIILRSVGADAAMPTAAGRTVAHGTQGLSSSKNLETLTRRTIRQAIATIKKELARREKINAKM